LAQLKLLVNGFRISGGPFCGETVVPGGIFVPKDGTAESGRDALFNVTFAGMDDCMGSKGKSINA
jgi:hypothetical protein